MTRGRFEFDQGKADQIDTAEALALLGALRHDGEGVWLQTFADGPDDLYILEQKTGKTGRPYLLKKFKVSGVPAGNGKTRAPVLRAENWGWADLAARPYVAENLARCGVYFAVNVLAADAPRRKAEHVTRVAAVFLDLDGAPMPTDFPLQPTATVESSSGRHHVYWAVDGVPLEEFSVIQKHLAGLYGADPVVHDLPRVMRLPGYWHGKGETGELVKLTSITPEAQYTRADLLEAWPTLAETLAAAEAERERQQQDAQQRREEADQLRAQISSGAAGTRAEVQQKYGRVGLLALTANLLAAQVGQRNSTLNAVAYRAGRLIGAGVLEEAEARAELGTVAERVGLEAGETAATLSSGLEAGKAKPVDAGKIGEFVGVKREKKKPSSPALVKVAEATADQQQQHGDSLLSADQIPEPEGEGGTYSGQQVKELLGLSWPVLAADTDKAHAYRLYALAGDDLAYVPALGGYVAWNGQQWLSGEGKEGAGQVEAKSRAQSIGLAMRPEVERLLALYGVLAVDAAQAEARSGRDSEAAKTARMKAEAMEKAYFRLDRAAQATENDARQRAILSSAATIYSKLNPKRAQDFEPRPWVVGFQNGTWDRGEFRPARRDDHMLRLAPVAYQQGADRADWHAVLDRITGGDADLARTLQDVAGYALSGASSLRLLPWLYGEGGTGKGTFSEMLATVLGEMAETISPKHLATDADRERLGAVIWGKRVALCAEAGNARLDAESLKTLSGGDRLSVRKLYAESFTGRASHVLVMVANDAPRVEAYDDALKDRVLALPFKHPLKIGGPLLGGKRLEELRQDASSALVLGFAAWAVEGLERVYRTGKIHRAAVCQAATRDFWADVDPLRDFWPLCDPLALAVSGVPVAEFRAGYEQWAKDNGARALSSQKFNKAAKSVGLIQEKKENKRVWLLEKPALFPGSAEADQQQAGEESTRSTENDLIPVNPKTSLLREREEKGFTENGSKPVLSVPGWEGEEL